MPPTLPEIVTQFKQAWTTQLEPDAIVASCRHVGYQWRERCLTPVVTIQVCFVQMLHGNTAWSHLHHLTTLPVSASALVRLA